MKQNLLVVLSLSLFCGICSACPKAPDTVGTNITKMLNYVSASEKCVADEWRNFKENVEANLNMLTKKSLFFNTMGCDMFMKFNETYPFLNISLADYAGLCKFIMVMASPINASLSSMSTVLSTADTFFWDSMNSNIMAASAVVGSLARAILLNRFLAPGCARPTYVKFFKFCDDIVEELNSCTKQMIDIKQLDLHLSNAIRMWTVNYNTVFDCVKDVNINSTIAQQMDAYFCTLGNNATVLNKFDGIITSIDSASLWAKRLNDNVHLTTTACLYRAQYTISPLKMTEFESNVRDCAGSI